MSNNSDLRLNGLNPLGYLGVNPRTPVPFFSRGFDPVPTDYANFILGTIWLNTATEAIWMLVSKANNVSTWVMLSTGPTGTVTELTGDDAVHVLPVAGNINIIAGIATADCGSTTEFTGSGNTLKLNVTDANENTTIGDLAGGIMTGSRNTALGAQALSALTSGSFNTGIGSQAGTGITTADFNTLVGSRAGANLETGVSNILIGASSGVGYTTIESNNIILGPSSGTVGNSGEMWLGDFTNGTTTYVAGVSGVTVANKNIVTIDTVTGQLGSETGGGSGFVETLTGDTGGPIAPSSGNINIITNVSTLNSGSSVSISGAGSTLTFNITDASFNTLIGKSAGNNTLTGGTNTALGASALHALTSGSSNVIIGSSAGDALTTGSNNIALGDAAGDAYTTESNNIAINSAGVAADSGVLRIGSGTGAGPFQLQSAFISGINGVDVGDVSTVVTIAGDQLGSATITAGAGILITPSANTIEISATGGGGGGGSPIAFQGYLATNTGTGLTYPYSLGSTVALTTEFNDGSGFYPGDGAGTPASFTAPVTGAYQFTLTISGSDTANTSFPCTTHPLIVTPSASYYSPTNAGSGSGTSISPAQNSITVVVSLNAADVVTFQSNTVGFGTSTTRINGSSGGGLKQTWINGFLISGGGITVNNLFNYSATVGAGAPAYVGNLFQPFSTLSPGLVSTIFPVVAAVSNLNVYVVTNGSTSINDTVTFYKNGVSTALAVSIPGGATGVFSDNTHSISVAAGDLGYIQVSAPTGGNIKLVIGLDIAA